MSNHSNPFTYEGSLVLESVLNLIKVVGFFKRVRGNVSGGRRGVRVGVVCD